MAILGWPFYFGGPVIRLLILAMFVGCSSTKPTPYQKEKKQEGYRDSVFEDLRVATFLGNSYTKKDRAQSFAEFRAIETCAQDTNKHANIIDIFDKTVEKQITRSSGSTWGPSGFGAYPYYSRYTSFGFGVGYNTMNSNSWNETLIFPIMEVYYTCSNVVFRPEIMFKELSANQMNTLVKDVKGAIQVEKILPDGPNRSNILLGDIILKANNQRIEKVYELIRLFDDRNHEVEVVLLREGERVTVKMNSKNITSKVVEKEKQIIERVCTDTKSKKNKTLKNSSLCKRNAS
jgi:hypothetical protein